MSFLETVARHEKELLAKVSATETEAAEIIAAARSEASRLLEQKAREVDTEMVELRRKAEQERERTRDAILNSAKARLANSLANARSRVPATVTAIAEHVLPQGRRLLT